MTLLLKTATGILMLTFFVGKVLVHYYLDNKHNRSSSLLYSFMSPLPYFLPYKTEVDTSRMKLKQLCNLLLVLTGLSLVVNIISGVAIYLQYY